MGQPTKTDTLYCKEIQKILTQGLYPDPQKIRPHYDDGAQANYQYITDVFMKFDLQKGEFPITTLRPISLKLAIEEMLWIYQDQTSDMKVLENRGVRWWKPWALSDGTIGERYGKTVKNYDILNRTLEQLSSNPFSRRAIINLWQYRDLDQPAQLPPCAFQVSFEVRPTLNPDSCSPNFSKLLLDCSLLQRSSDFLVAGLGINQMQYVALQMMIAKHLGFELGTFSWHVMNLHIYDRHLEQAHQLLHRFEHYDSFDVNNSQLSFKLQVPDRTDFYNISASDFLLENYHPIQPQLKFELAI